MMKKKKKMIGIKSLPFAAMALISLLQPIPATAQESGVSITIAGNQDQTLVGKTFHIYKLFDVRTSSDRQSVDYSWNPVYKSALQNTVGKALGKKAASVTEYEVIDYMASLNEEGHYSQMRYFVEDLRTEIEKTNSNDQIVFKVESTNDQNEAVLSGLEHGYYLVDEMSVHGSHAAASLCMAQTANENIVIRIKSDYPEIIKKIEEDDNNVGWNDIADFEIGQTIPFKYETLVPDMNGYDTYKLVFEDRMDPSMDWYEDSVEIAISNGERTYTLKQNEWNVHNDAYNHRFEVTIENLKEIVDTQFPEGMDDTGHNAYGQTITLRYDGYLKDEAADQTGRPGFENSVRLVYSNNPDANGTGEVGVTPWDTVVCFTYKIDGSKVNEAGTQLKDAKFRLYRDPDCTDEVFVKQGANGYIVSQKEGVEMVSDQQGQFIVHGLDQGMYYLKETKAPDGYRPLLDPIEIEIIPTFTEERNQYIEGDGAGDQVLKDLQANAIIKDGWNGSHGLETTVADGSVQLEVINKKGAVLPRTGSSMSLILLSSGTALALYALKKQKNDEKENK